MGDVETMLPKGVGPDMVWAWRHVVAGCRLELGRLRGWLQEEFLRGCGGCTFVIAGACQFVIAGACQVSGSGAWFLGSSS